MLKGEVVANIEKAMVRYTEVYKALYRRTPGELRDLGGGWVVVNGARMTTPELEQLTAQLQRELQQEQLRKRNIVQRLLGWFNG